MSSSKSHSRRPWWSTLGIYAGLSLAAFIMVIPLLFSFVTAFKSPQDFASHSPFALPSPPSLASFQAILTGRVNFGDAIITTLLRLKPSAAKGTYVKSIYLSSTMSPSIKIDPKSVEE